MSYDGYPCLRVCVEAGVATATLDHPPLVQRFRTMPKARSVIDAGVCRGGGSELALSRDVRFTALGKAVLSTRLREVLAEERPHLFGATSSEKTPRSSRTTPEATSTPTTSASAYSAARRPRTRRPARAASRSEI